jgi:hypothetical protein
MKIIITAEKKVFVEVQPAEGTQVAFTDVVGVLELVKQMVIGQWQEQLANIKEDDADAENNETIGD